MYGHGGEVMQTRLQDEPVVGLTSRAIRYGACYAASSPVFADDENILMLYGDGPLITAETLQTLIAAKPEHGIALLTVVLDDPTGYGRIVRENGNVVAIVEQKMPMQSN